MYKGLALLLLPPSLSGPLSSLPLSPSSSLALSPSLLSGLPSSLTHRLSCRLSHISYGVTANRGPYVLHYKHGADIFDASKPRGSA